MRQQIDALRIKGSILVIKNDKIMLNYALGNNTDTSYLINSVQKSMTAAIIMHLVQEGKLSLQDKLSKFYPQIAGAKKVRLKNLLAMTAGLELKSGARLGQKHFVSDQDNIQHDAANTVFEPALLNKWHYSSLNYVYLCGIMSKITGQSYEQLFRDTYVRPLKLQQTEFLWSKPGKIVASGLVPGMVYRKGRYDVVKHQAALRDAHSELGAGSVVMSNHDLAKTVHYILAGKLLTKASCNFLYQAAPPAYYNGGFYNDKSHNIKKANGGGAGYYTFLRSSDDGKTIIVIQSNKTKEGEFDILRSQINKIMVQLLK